MDFPRKTCAYCFRALDGFRAHAKTCSPVCRQSLYRIRAREKAAQRAALAKAKKRKPKKVH